METSITRQVAKSPRLVGTALRVGRGVWGQVAGPAHPARPVSVALSRVQPLHPAAARLLPARWRPGGRAGVLACRGRAYSSPHPQEVTSSHSLQGGVGARILGSGRRMESLELRGGVSGGGGSGTAGGRGFQSPVGDEGLTASGFGWKDRRGRDAVGSGGLGRTELPTAGMAAASPSQTPGGPWRVRSHVGLGLGGPSHTWNHCEVPAGAAAALSRPDPGRGRGGLSQRGWRARAALPGAQDISLSGVHPVNPSQPPPLPPLHLLESRMAKTPSTHMLSPNNLTRGPTFPALR